VDDDSGSDKRLALGVHKTWTPWRVEEGVSLGRGLNEKTGRRGERVVGTWRNQIVIAFFELVKVGKRIGQVWHWVGRSVETKLSKGGKRRMEGRSRVDPSSSHLFSCPYPPFGPSCFVRPPKDKAGVAH
jgi:hypothetical protein